MEEKCMRPWTPGMGQSKFSLASLQVEEVGISLNTAQADWFGNWLIITTCGIGRKNVDATALRRRAGQLCFAFASSSQWVYVVIEVAVWTCSVGSHQTENNVIVLMCQEWRVKNLTCNCCSFVILRYLCPFEGRFWGLLIWKYFCADILRFLKPGRKRLS